MVSWKFYKDLALVISVVSAVVLLGFASPLGISAATSIMSTGFTYGQLLGFASAYIALILWKSLAI